MEANTTSKAEANRQLVVGAIEAAMAGDMEGFTDSLHPEVEVHEPDYLPYGGVYRGKDGFMELFGKATAVLDFPTMAVESATGGEDRAILLMTCKLLSNGEERHITEHWEIEDGLVKRVRVFWFGLPS
jgi:ketosteroid isomerase-like protein